MTDVQTIDGDDCSSLSVNMTESVVARSKCRRRARPHKCLEAVPSQFLALEVLHTSPKIYL